MNQKKARRLRAEGRARFAHDHRVWECSRPSRLFFIQFLKWKKSEPKESDYV